MANLAHCAPRHLTESLTIKKSFCMFLPHSHSWIAFCKIWQGIKWNKNRPVFLEINKFLDQFHHNHKATVCVNQVATRFKDFDEMLHTYFPILKRVAWQKLTDYSLKILDREAWQIRIFADLNIPNALGKAWDSKIVTFLTLLQLWQTSLRMLFNKVNFF